MRSKMHFTDNVHNILPFVFFIFPGILPLSVLIRLCHKCSDLNSRQLAPSWLCRTAHYNAVSDLLFCSPTWLASPKASRVADNLMSHSNFSASSALVTQASASNWASGSKLPTMEASPPWHHLFPFLPKCTLCSCSNISE